jgi:hypothetical protein
MHLKTQCTNVLPNWTFGKYTAVDARVGRLVLKLNFGRLGDWLDGKALRGPLRKLRAGPSLAAEASRARIQEMLCY